MTMPVWLLKAFESGKTKIEAQEAINDANIAAVASSNMKKSSRDRILNRWKRAANQGASSSPKLGTREAASMFGFAYIEEKSDV